MAKIAMTLIPVFFALVATAPLAATPAPRAVVSDAPRDDAFPAMDRQLLVPSHGEGMNALLLAASGKGPHPVVILMHGLPGNERNFDLAQAIRRSGWDVLTFTYRGAWGSPGEFSISGAMEDTGAALAFARSPQGAGLGIDARRIVLAGHSFGGDAAAVTAAAGSGVEGLILIDAVNLGAIARRCTRTQLIARLDDFGNALRGTSPATIADAILKDGRRWDIDADAAKLKALPILTVTALHGGAVGNRATTEALRAAGNERVVAVEMDTDHAFADHRIALATTVVQWLEKLPLQ